MKSILRTGSAILGLLIAHSAMVYAQGVTPTADFHSMAAQLAGDRENAQIGQPAEAGDQALEEKALESLDAIVLKELSADSAPDLAALNKTLGSLVSAENPTGEDYEVVKLAGAAPTYALVANFGLAGPSAVRIYAESAAHLALVGQIDCYNTPKFFDENLVLVPIVAPETVFMTVAGRTDDLQTGIFTAWYFDGQTLRQAWTSDLWQQSSYEIDSAGVQVTYCAKPDDDNPGQCHSMERDTFAWDDGAWKRQDSKILGPAVNGQ